MSQGHVTQAEIAVQEGHLCICVKSIIIDRDYITFKGITETNMKNPTSLTPIKSKQKKLHGPQFEASWTVLINPCGDLLARALATLAS